MVDRVSLRRKRKTVQFRGMFVWTFYSTFKLSILPFAFHNKRVQTLFKTNPPDPSQRVPLIVTVHYYDCAFQVHFYKCHTHLECTHFVQFTQSTIPTARSATLIWEKKMHCLFKIRCNNFEFLF